MNGMSISHRSSVNKITKSISLPETSGRHLLCEMSKIVEQEHVLPCCNAAGFVVL